jgi:hypothetical protein
MRAKQEYVLETNDKGKQVPKKVGMAPVQREGMEYEFTVMLDVDMNHVASASKDRTGLFDGRFFKLSEETGKELLEWLETGKEPPKVDEKLFADHMAAIEASGSLESLQAAFAAAYRAAKAINDSHAMALFNDAKDTRKNALTNPEKEAA